MFLLLSFMESMFRLIKRCAHVETRFEDCLTVKVHHLSLVFLRGSSLIIVWLLSIDSGAIMFFITLDMFDNKKTIMGDSTK